MYDTDSTLLHNDSDRSYFGCAVAMKISAENIHSNDGWSPLKLALIQCSILVTATIEYMD